MYWKTPISTARVLLRAKKWRLKDKRKHGPPRFEYRNHPKGVLSIIKYRNLEIFGEKSRYIQGVLIRIRDCLRSRWPHGLKCGSVAPCLLRLRVRISPGALISVYCECCVLSGRGLCNGLIPHAERGVLMSVIRFNNRPLNLQ